MNRVTYHLVANIIKPDKAVNTILKKWPIHKVLYEQDQYLKENDITINSSAIISILNKVNYDKRVLKSPILIFYDEDVTESGGAFREPSNLKTKKRFCNIRHTSTLPDNILKNKYIVFNYHLASIRLDLTLKDHYKKLKGILVHEWIHLKQLIRDKKPYRGKKSLSKEVKRSNPKYGKKEILYYSDITEIMAYAKSVVQYYRNNDIEELTDVMSIYYVIGNMYPTVKKKFLKYFYLYMQDAGYDKQIKKVLRKYWKGLNNVN